MHACAVGELLQSAAVIFPPQASVLSAFGALVTPVRLDLVRSALGRLDDLDWDEVDRLIGDMTVEAQAALAEAGAAPDQVRLEVGADLRYFGQQNEVGITFDNDPRAGRDAEAIRRTFETAYFAQYGVNPSHVPIEIVSWRLTAQGPEDRGQETRRRRRAPGVPKRTLETPLWADAGPAKSTTAPALARGQSLNGPA